MLSEFAGRIVIINGEREWRVVHIFRNLIEGKSMNGLEAYDKLKASTSDLPFGSVVDVDYFHAIDLRKLTSADLVARGFDQVVAERVDCDLLGGSIEELGKGMGLQLRRLAPGSAVG